jgi:hypothetical protein
VDIKQLLGFCFLKTRKGNNCVTSGCLCLLVCLFKGLSGVVGLLLWWSQAIGENYIRHDGVAHRRTLYLVQSNIVRSCDTAYTNSVRFRVRGLLGQAPHHTHGVRFTVR